MKSPIRHLLNAAVLLIGASTLLYAQGLTDAAPLGTVWNNYSLAHLTPAGPTISVIRLGVTVAGDAPPMQYNWSPIQCPAPDSGAQVAPDLSLGITGCWMVQQTVGNVMDDREWGVVGNGVTDDTAAFTAALSWCNAGGPATSQNRVVNIGASRIVANFSPSITFGCTVSAAPLIAGNTSNNPLAILRPGAILLGSGNTITVASGTLENIGVFPSSLTPATSFQDALTKIAAFSGTGVTLGGNNTILSHLVIVGFNTCVGSTGTQQARSSLEYIYVDCTNGFQLDSFHDVASIITLRGWEFFNGNTSYSQDKETVSNVADNGSGLLRLTIGSTANMATGNSLVMASIGGALGANGVWPVTVIDSTHVDLQGSSSTTFTATGTEITGQALVTGLSAMTEIWPGETVTGTGVPSSTTVLAVDPINGNIWLSKIATATGSETLTFTAGTYTSGGTALLDASHRTGIFLQATHSEENHFADLFEFGWQVGYNPSTGTQWQIFHNIGCDGNFWVNNVCIRVDGNSIRSQFVGVNVTGGPIAIDDNSAGQGSLYRGVYSEREAINAPNKSTIILENNSQLIDLDGRDNASLAYLLDYDTGGTKNFTGLWGATRYLQSTIPALLNTATPQPILVGRTSFTPSVAFGGGSTGLGLTVFGGYDIDSTGRMAISAKLVFSAVGSSTGAATITQLPAPCLTPAVNPPGVGVVGVFTGMASAVTAMTLSGDPTNGDVIDFKLPATAGASVAATNASFGNNSLLYTSYSCYTR
jgi:hypothetical protein